MDVATTQAEIAVTKALLTALGAAILALADPTVQSYQLDTGQTSQRVTRHDLPSLYAQRRALMSELSGLELRLTGRGARLVVPAC